MRPEDLLTELDHHEESVPQDLLTMARGILGWLKEGRDDDAEALAEDLAIELSAANALEPNARQVIDEVLLAAGMQPREPLGQRLMVAELVAWNFRRARTLRGWTQEEVAERLEPLLGSRWSSATMSIAERGYVSKNRTRGFTTEEVAAFAQVFDLPIPWFFLPPDDDEDDLHLAEVTTDPNAEGLSPPEQVRLALGANEQLAAALEERLERTQQVLPEDYATALVEVLQEGPLLKGQTKSRVRRAVSSLRELTDLLEDLLEDQD